MHTYKTMCKNTSTGVLGCYVRPFFLMTWMIFQRYFLSCARSALSRSNDSIPASLSWICHPEGHRFFVEGSWKFGPKESIFTTCDGEGTLGWSGGAKVLCILHHWGVQLILTYSWARPAILVVGKGRGGMFLFLLFLHFHSCSSFFPVPLFHLLYSLFYLFSPFLWETTQNDPQGLTCR